MTTKEKMKIMQAYEDGKLIQMLTPYAGWIDLDSEPEWDWGASDYRIKPEALYRPYENTEEMIEDFKERFIISVPDYEMPLIWLKYQNVTEIIVMGFREDDISIDSVWWTMEELYDEFTYLDGSPVGKLVE